ncbi:FUN14 family-containing protein [Strongyloides ratti]|uniref:FUN14 family-containing protein n=1 Tax=Strongyloides ratti TaxID=34506 RepID=A0A090L5U4_STRRB|nr:FUN14 family-containing protein [Strongyloides ratti]CEF63492.1 FUN14 family-containing protein [Strongyloides ratti]
MVDLDKFISENLTPRPKKNSLSDYLNYVIDYVKNVNRKPVYIQFGIGGGCGLVLGYIFSKTSRLLSIATGVSIVIFQFLIHKGYLRFNETQIERDVRNLKESVLSELGVNDSSIIPKGKDFQTFFKKNVYTFSGLAAGTFIGYGLS